MQKREEKRVRMKKIILFLLIGIFLVNILSFACAGFAANTTTYRMHNESDSQFSAYHQLRNASTDLSMITSAGLSTDSLGISCWNDNWISPNFTGTTSVNGAWNFSLNYSTSTGSSPKLYLFAKIFKLNATGRFDIANSGQSANVGGQTAKTVVLWGYNLASSSLTNLSAGERVGVQFCINVTFVRQRTARIYWENSTRSSLRIPIAYFTSAPNVNIVYPANMTYTADVSALNYTSSGASSCWWSNSSGIWNSSVVSAGTNWTGLTSAEGSNNWRVWCNNSFGDLNSSSVSFFKDTIAPSILIMSPANITYNNLTQLINISSNGNNVWFFNGTANATYTAPILVKFNEGSNTLRAYANDTAGNSNQTSVTFSVDSCVPNLANTSWSAWQNQGSCNINDLQLQNRSKIQYDSNSCGEISNLTYWDYQSIGCNYCSYNIVNSSWTDWTNLTCLADSTMNQTRSKTEYDSNYATCYAITNLPSDLWNSGNNITYSEFRNTEACTQDNTAPTITLTSPQDGATYGYNNSIALDFSASDTNGNLERCWYNLNGGSNVDIINCQNTTVDAHQGINTIRVYVNDSYGLQAYDEATFNVDIGAPTIILNSPIDIYLNNSYVTFYYMPIDTDLASCELWGDFNGEFKLNQTSVFLINNVINTFSLNLGDGTYRWNVRCTDKAGHASFNGNKTFYIDTDIDNDGLNDYADNLIYNKSNVLISGLALFNIKLNGTSDVDSNGWSGENTMGFYDSNVLFLNFTHNFTRNKIDLSKVSIEKTGLSLVINLSGQLAPGEKKTIYLGDNSFASLCVKDADIASASQISSTCNGTNETDFSSCLGNSTGVAINNIVCYDEGQIIRIENLSHSGVRGTQAPSLAAAVPGLLLGCLYKWNCGEWGACSAEGKQTRTCSNAGTCLSGYNAPKTEQNCIPSEKALFDITLTVINPQITAGETLTAKVSLVNFGNKTNLNVSLNYKITDSNNETVLSEKETVPVEIQNEFIKEFALPSQTAPGKYNLFAEITYEGQEKEAFSQGSFEIISGKQGIFSSLTGKVIWNETGGVNYWAIGILLLVIIIAAYVLIKSKYFGKWGEERQLREEDEIKEKVNMMLA